MADPQYTDAQLSDGTTLRFNGQLDPDQVRTKVAAYRAARAPVRHHGTSSSWGPEADAPDSQLAKIGAYVPEAAVPALQWSEKYLVRPFEYLASKGVQAGRELGRESLGMGSDPNVQKKYGMEKSVPLQTALGVTEAVGSVAGGTVADPRNWPLMASSAARPILQRMMAAGFGAQMGKGAIDSTEQLYSDWDKLSPEQRAELGTKAGISTLMARLSVQHAIGGRPAAAESVPPKEEVQARAATSPGPVQHTQAPEVTPPSVTRPTVTPSTQPVSDVRTLPKSEPQAITTSVSPVERPKVPTQEGEIVEPSHNYPSKETMAFRGFKKLEYSQRGLRMAIATGDTAKIDSAQQRVIADATDWAKYARPEEVNQAMQGLHNNASLLADQIGPMQNLNKGLFQGKVSFRESADPSVQQMSRADFRKIAGADLPKVPKDYLDNLPDETRNAIPPKGRERQEAINRLWATDFLEQRGKNLVDQFDRARELQAAIAKTRGLTPPTRESYFLAKNAQPAETTASTEVGRAATRPAESQQVVQQPVQAAQAAPGPGEPVRPAKGPEVSPFDEMAAYQPGRGVHEPPSKVEAPETNYFKLAQEELRGKLNREPSISEVVQRATALKTELTGSDPEYDKRVEALTRRGVAPGTAERMVREQLAKEKSWTEKIEGYLKEGKTVGGGTGTLPPTWRLANFLDRLATLGGALERSPQETRARDITREYASGLALDQLKLEARLKEAINRHDADGEAEFRTFMDAGEGKQVPFMSVEDAGTAQELHSMFQDRWGQVQQVLDREPGGIENYLAHLWKKPGIAKDTMSRFFGRRPLEGNKIFLKQRFYDYASDGLDHGLEPITYNPIRLQLTALFQLDKFLAAHELKDMYKDAGLAKWTKLGDRSNPDWQPLNDKIFQPKVMKDGGLTEYGQYKAPADVAKIFNRYLDPGLRGNPTYDTIRQYGNFLNQINLGVSGYHGMFITAVAGASDVGLGIEKIFNNRDLGGFKNIFRGTIGTFLAQSAIKDYQLGRKIQAEAINPTGDARLQAYVDSLIEAGARFDQDPMYETSARKFFTALKTGHPIEAIKSGVQNLSKPIMKYYVPRVKLGMAASMMESKLQFLIKQGISDPATVANEMGKIYDSVENRAGQMTYDNLFWNKAAKDLAFLGVRAVGWDFGSMREGLGGLWKDPLQQAAQALRGKRPIVPTRTAFVAGTIMTIGTLGAVTTYLATGKPPQKLEDYFYPPSGRMGADGKPERMSYPSYMKDAFSIVHDVGNLKADTALHKAHPMINQVVELLQNKDYYNTEIRSEGDPWYDQAGQVGKWYGKSLLPFSATMAAQRHKQGIPGPEAYAESFFGLQRAPSYVTQSPAEEMTLDFAKRNWAAGPLTSEQRAQRDTFNKFRTQVALGKLDTKAVSDAFRQGQLRPQDLDRLFEGQGLSSFQQEFKNLKLPEALKVMKVASADERQALKPLLVDKIDQLENFPVPEEQAYYQGQIQKYLQ